MTVPSQLQKLIEYFMSLPGVGPRQAARFAYAMLDKPHQLAEDFAEALTSLHNDVTRCITCGRVVSKTTKHEKCELCRNSNIETIFIVEKDQDADAVLKSGHYRGHFHVLGGLVFDAKRESHVHAQVKKLFTRLKEIQDLNPKKNVEIILGLPVTPDGESTSLYIERVIEPFTLKKFITLSRVARGMSTGAQFEFSDPETIRHALKNRNGSK